MKNKTFPVRKRTGLSHHFLDKASTRILFQLVNSKIPNKISHAIYEDNKFSTTIENLLYSNYRTVDYNHDSIIRKESHKLYLVVDSPLVLNKENKSKIENLIKINKDYLSNKDNKIINQKAIEDNIKYFEEKILSL